jgi:hypothetical protein
VSEQRQPIDEQLLREAQRRTDAHQVTIMRRMLGLPVRGRVAARVDRVLAELGVAVPERV